MNVEFVIICFDNVMIIVIFVVKGMLIECIVGEVVVEGLCVVVLLLWFEGEMVSIVEYVEMCGGIVCWVLLFGIGSVSEVDVVKVGLVLIVKLLILGEIVLMIDVLDLVMLVLVCLFEGVVLCGWCYDWYWICLFVM